MTREEIIRMAREAGLSITPPRSGQYSGGQVGCDMVSLERFAALVAAHERAACAKVVESAMPLGKILDTAAAIRARGLK